MTVLAVTGTGTGVGKTIVTAALACHARQAGLDIAVCKPVQTGIADGEDDLAAVARLSGVTELAGLARYPQALAPPAAAEQAGIPLPRRADVVELVHGLDRPDRLTLLEGAGGLLVELAIGPTTLRDLAVHLGSAVLVVTTAELGTLNYTALTLESLAVHQLSCAGVVIGSWPDQPETVHLSNRCALARMAPVRAVLPAGAGRLTASEFAAMSARVFDSSWVTSLLS